MMLYYIVVVRIMGGCKIMMCCYVKGVVKQKKDILEKDFCVFFFNCLIIDIIVFQELEFIQEFQVEGKEKLKFVLVRGEICFFK